MGKAGRRNVRAGETPGKAARAAARRVEKTTRGSAGPERRGRRGWLVPVGVGRCRNREGRAQWERTRWRAGQWSAPWEPRR